MAQKIFPYLEDAKRSATSRGKEIYKMDDGTYYVGTYTGAIKENAKRSKFRKIKK